MGTVFVEMSSWTALKTMTYEKRFFWDLYHEYYADHSRIKIYYFYFIERKNIYIYMCVIYKFFAWFIRYENWWAENATLDIRKPIQKIHFFVKFFRNFISSRYDEWIYFLLQISQNLVVVTLISKERFQSVKIYYKS